MKHEVYASIKVTDDFDTFDFVSTGKNGVIRKRISFIKTESDNVYNLAFGDVDKDGKVNYYSVSNNGDRNKILATVVNVVGEYTEEYPDRWIFFSGSTNERTRLYRMAVGLNLKELSAEFEIYGYADGQIVPFTKNLKIDGFLVKRKFF
jgi:hypothetical protein